MNETLRIQHTHRSIRSYTDEPVSDAMLDAIVESAHRAPTSRNSQEISLVVVRDAQRRARIAQLAGGQAWIAQAPVFIVIVIDFRKTALGMEKDGKKQLFHQGMEGYGVGAVDAGIALGTMITAAESLGLGIVPIGGIRRSPQALIDLLGLPPLTFPMVGLVVGHIAGNVEQKPRLGLGAFRHDERYDDSRYLAEIDDYDTTIMDYWQRLNRTDGLPWSANLAPYASSVYYPDVKPVAAKQGFLNDK
jgi:FMN reductase [NAD(P)H]